MPERFRQRELAQLENPSHLRRLGGNYLADSALVLNGIARLRTGGFGA
jgi:hypothetical protein